jgi:hypothetical protein
LSRDVQVIERVLVEEVRLVEQEHRVDALGRALLDVAGDRVEERARHRGGLDTDGVAELAIEVAATERGVVAVRELEAGRRDAVAQRAEHAGLADTWLADEDDRGALVERLEQRLDDRELGRRQPQLGVGNLLRERRVLAAEVREVGGAAHLSPPRRRAAAGDRRVDRAARRRDRTASASRL